MFLANIMLLDKIKETLTHKDEIVKKLAKIKHYSEEAVKDLDKKNEENSKQKRFRRSAKEIERAYNCPQVKCNKAYGNEGCLNQHIKQKHKKYWMNYQTNKSIKRCEKHSKSNSKTYNSKVEDTVSQANSNGLI